MPHLLNTTHLSILEKVPTHSLKGFGQYTKHYLIEKYSDICLIHNCHVCNLTTPDSLNMYVCMYIDIYIYIFLLATMLFIL